jgi:hypothetical protein
VPSVAAVHAGEFAMIRIAERVHVYVNPQRDLHGPAVVRTGSGDLLLCHQDSQQHRGGDGFAHQWRSVDDGATWQDEGPAADWRSRNIDSLFGEYGLAPSGRIVMIVQRREVLTQDAGILASWLQMSEDEGRSWTEIGPVDDSDEHAVMYGRNILTRGGVMYMGAWSRLGNALYVSHDDGLSWERRSVIFPVDYPDFGKLSDAGPPFYPHVIFCADGSMLAMTYHTPPIHHCYSRRSMDDGLTWGPIIKEQDLDLWAPRMRRFDGNTLIVTGRDITIGATVAWFSRNSGVTWGDKLVIDKPEFTGSYAYSDSIAARDGGYWVFASSPQSAGKGDIIGVRLEVD